MTRELLKVDEVADRLSISRSKAYLMMSAGLLPIVRIGRAVRVPVRALAEWVDVQITGGTNPGR